MNHNVSNVLIEHLPRLQCCNVHINYDTVSCHQHQQRPAHIQLTDQHIELIVDANHDNDDSSSSSEKCTTRIELPRSLYVNASTVSLLVHRPSSISFRVCTDRAHTFDEELLCRTMPTACRIDDEQSKRRTRLQPSVRPGQRVRLRCTNCDQLLSADDDKRGGLKFGRVLELPSENCDAADWFCCQHKPSTDSGCDANEHDSAERVQNSAKMDVRPLDLLYGLYSFVVHSQRLSASTATVIRDRRAVHCSSCDIRLGDYLRHNATMKLWNEAINFVVLEPTVANVSGPDVFVTTIASPMPLFSGTLSQQFVVVVQRAIEDFAFLKTTVALPQIVRCLFDCQVTDTATNGGQNMFLFVQVMNPNLEVWRLADAKTTATADTNTTLMALEPFNYIKVMYRTVRLDAAVPDPPLVASWRSDNTVHCMSLSERMFQAADDHLLANSHLMAESWRRSASLAGFVMSYLW